MAHFILTKKVIIRNLDQYLANALYVLVNNYSPKEKDEYRELR